MALFKAKQIDFDDFMTKFFVYLDANPTSKQYFLNLINRTLVETTPNASYISSLVFSAITDTSVNVAWTAVPIATSYEIEITEYANAFSTRRITGITTTNYTVTGLNPSMTYDIKVRSIFPAV